jgi:hypothetical protein
MNAQLSRLDFMRTRTMGEDVTLKLLRIFKQPPNGFKLVRVVTKQFNVGQQKAQGGGPLIDVLIIEETDEVTHDEIDASEACEVVYSETRSERYMLEAKTPPRGSNIRWLITLRASKDRSLIAAS